MGHLDVGLYAVGIAQITCAFIPRINYKLIDTLWGSMNLGGVKLREGKWGWLI